MRWTSYLISLLIHGLVGFLLTLDMNDESSDVGEREIWVELVAPEENESIVTRKKENKALAERRALPSKNKSGQSANKKTVNGQENSSIEKFLPQFDSRLGVAPNHRGEAELSALEQSLSYSLQEHIELEPFKRQIWQNIASVLDYPEEFIERRVAGNVAVTIELNGAGQFSGRYLKVSSSNRFLKVYVMTILLHALEGKIEKRFRLDRSVMLQFNFKFELVSYIDDSVRRKNYAAVGNYLEFNQSRYSDPKVVRLIKKWRPPLIPMPGGLMIDFIRAYEIVTEWNQPDREVIGEVKLKQFERRLKATLKSNPRFAR